MRANMSYAIQAIIALSIALASCGRGEEPKNNGAFGEAPRFLQENTRDVVPGAEAPHESANIIRDDRLVSLKPPYTAWKTNRTDPQPRLSLQNAARALCLQAGKTYDFDASRRNTDPICRRWVQPDIDEKPWEEAMEELLAPFDITYITRGNSVVLIKPEDLEKFEQKVQGVASDVARFDSPDTQPPRLHDAVGDVPPLDADKETAQRAKYNVMFSQVSIVTAVLIIITCIPLLMGKIGMNGWYGIRTPKAFKSEENWYKINKYGAQRLILWSTVYMVVGILALFLSPISEKEFILLISIGPFVFIAIPIIEILLYSRKL